MSMSRIISWGGDVTSPPYDLAAAVGTLDVVLGVESDDAPLRPVGETESFEGCVVFAGTLSAEVCFHVLHPDAVG